MTLEELRVIEDHLGQLDQQMADLLAARHDAVQRLAEAPASLTLVADDTPASSRSLQ